MGYTDKEKRKDYARKWRAARRNYYLQLRGNCCEKCTFRENLEFHHRDKEEKISHKIFSWSAKRLEEELSKCDLLCAKCHLIETAEERKYYQAPHGSLTSYKNYKCRCEWCKKANADYERKSRKLRMYETLDVVIGPG